MPGRPEEEGGKTDADQNQAAREVDNEGDQLMLSVAENLNLNSTRPNSRKHRNPSWSRLRGSRDADN